MIRRQPERYRSSSRVNRGSPDAEDRTGQPSQPTPTDLLNHGPSTGRDARALNAALSWGGGVGDLKLVRLILF